MPLKAVTWLLPLLFVVATINVYATTEPFVITTNDNRVFHVSVSYEIENAYVGNESFRFDMSITSNGTGVLLLKECKPQGDAKIDTRINQDDVLKPRCTLIIKSEVVPDKYEVVFGFEYSGRIFRQSLFLPIGVRSNKNTSGGEWITIKPKPNPIEFYADRSTDFPFAIKNNFNAYTVIITKVDITSDRPELLSNVTHTLSPPNEKIGAEQTRQAVARFDVAAMSWRDVIFGFPEKINLIVDVTYTDGYGRIISDATQEFPITLKPRDRTLIFAILIGVFVGALLKIYLQRLQSQGVISRREAVKAMAITILIGLVVSVIALAGEIKITAFAFTGSYDKPIVIFMIGLTGALIGAQLLMSWFKRLTKKESD